MPLNFALGTKTYEPVSRTITADEIAAYAAATSDDNPAFAPGADQIAPPIFPVVLGLPLMATVTLDPELGVDNPLMIVHGEEEIIHHRAVRAGETLVLTPSLVSVEDKGRSGVFVARVAATTPSGDPVNDQYATIVVRGAGSGADRAPSEPAAVAGRGPQVASFSSHVDTEMPGRYAQASGDHNPIHLDESIATAVGLPGVINHGLGTLALVVSDLVAEAFGADPQQVRRVQARFTDVVLPGSDLSTTVWESSGGSLSFETTRPDGTTVIVGEVEVAQP
jgi:acyl dehydratase